MAAVESPTYSANANRLGRTNIVVPVTTTAAQVLLDAAAARLEIAARNGYTAVTGGVIGRSLD